MTVAQKREIERALNWFSKDCGKNEIVGIRITLDILGYWVFLTEKGYEIRKKGGGEMITKRQKEELEEEFNFYSYLAELYKHLGNSLEYERYFAKMWALKNAFYILGYIIKREKQDEKDGIKYYYYEFVKE